MAQQHGADAGDAEHTPVQLAHLSKDVCLLHPFDDSPLVEVDVVEEAGLVAVFGCRCPIQAAQSGA